MQYCIFYDIAICLGKYSIIVYYRVVVIMIINFGEFIFEQIFEFGTAKAREAIIGRIEKDKLIKKYNEHAHTGQGERLPQEQTLPSGIDYLLLKDYLHNRIVQTALKYYKTPDTTKSQYLQVLLMAGHGGKPTIPGLRDI